MNCPIDYLDFSVRKFNVLKRANIRTVGDLIRCNESKLISLRNFWDKNLNEVKAQLREYDLSLSEDDETL